MKLHPRLSRAAVELVARFETYHATAQPAAGGGWTVGYGHTRSARQGAYVTRDDARALLLYDLAAAADVVETSLFAPVSQRQFEALSAFCFNIGAENFRRSSALARLNAGAELEAADEIERWRRAELGAGAQVVDALVRRRAAEKAHFLGLPEGFSKSPRAVLRPLPGEDGAGREADVAAPQPAASATLQAADSVRARLRELVPEPGLAPDLEPEPPPFAPAAVPLHAEPAGLPIETLAAGGETGLPADATAPAPTPELAAPAPYVAPPPPPPSAHDEPSPPANDAAPHVIDEPAPGTGEVATLPHVEDASYSEATPPLETSHPHTPTSAAELQASASPAVQASRWPRRLSAPEPLSAADRAGRSAGRGGPGPHVRE